MARNDIRNRPAPPAPDPALGQLLTAAVGHASEGRFEEAATLLEAAPKSLAMHPAVQNVLGSVYLDLKRPREALKALDRALKAVPGFPEALCNRGVALQDLGRNGDALASLDMAIRLRPTYAKAHFNRGNTLAALGRTDDGIAAFSAALKIQPEFPEALLNRGNAHLDKGDLVDALSDFNRALGQRPDYPEAQISLASAYRRLGRHDEALVTVDRVIAKDAENKRALLTRAEIQVDNERYDLALADADAVLETYPDYPEALATRAMALWRLHRVDDAIAGAHALLKQAPSSHDAYSMLGELLGEVGRFDEQIHAFEKGAKLAGKGSSFLYLKGRAAYARRDLPGAIAAYGEAIKDGPPNPQIGYNRSMIGLELGDYEHAWKWHEARLDLPVHRKIAFAHMAPRWNGEDVRGKKLLVHAEQGHGDTLQFARYLQLIRERGAHITFMVPPQLVDLLAPMLDGIEISNVFGFRKGYDYQVSLMSLPYICGTRMETIPANVPYVVPDPARVAKWRDRLSAREGYRIGIVWQGNPKYLADRLRSPPLINYAAVARIPGVRLISLQALYGLDQLKALPPDMQVEELGPEVTNNPDGMAEIAAVMPNLDLLVTSDTGLAHLAGAMAMPIYVALTLRPDWRWLIDRSDSPWYPTMRLFRQKSYGAWQQVFEEIAAAVKERMAGPGG